MPFQFLGYERMKEDFSHKMDTYAGFKKVPIVSKIPADRLKYIMFVKSVISLLDQGKFPHPKKATPEEIAREKSIILSGILYALAEQLYKRGSQLASSFEAVVLGEDSLNMDNKDLVSKSFDIKNSKLGIIDDCEAFKMLETAERFYIHNVFKEGKLKNGRLTIHSLMAANPALTINFSKFEKTLVDLKQKNNGGIYTASWENLKKETLPEQSNSGFFSRISSMFSSNQSKTMPESILDSTEADTQNLSEDLELSKSNLAI